FARDAKLRLAVLQSRLENAAHFLIQAICWIHPGARAFERLRPDADRDAVTTRPAKENLGGILRRKSARPCSGDGRFRSSASGNRGDRKNERLSDKTARTFRMESNASGFHERDPAWENRFCESRCYFCRQG